MRERLVIYQEEYGDLYNLEATPAESTTYRLAKHDKELYPDIITATENDAKPYYTNSSHLPVGYTEDIFEALDIQDELQTLYTSGTVFHAFLGEKLPDWKAAAALVRKISENYKLPYYTISPTYSICRNHGYISGEVYECPHCGEKTEVYSRITGYYRPVQNWNEGKTQEFSERKVYDIGHSVLKGKQALSDVQTPCEKAEGKLLLFTTKTCPNCKAAYQSLEQSKLSYEKVDAEEQEALARQYGIMQVPTLVVVKEDGFEKIGNAWKIREFAEMNHQQ